MSIKTSIIYYSDATLLLSWLEKNVDYSPQTFTRLTGRPEYLAPGLYTEYVDFCKKCNKKPISRIIFSKELQKFAKNKNWKIDKTRDKSGIVFRGLLLVSEKNETHQLLRQH